MQKFHLIFSYWLWAFEWIECRYFEQTVVKKWVSQM